MKKLLPILIMVGAGYLLMQQDAAPPEPLPKPTPVKPAPEPKKPDPPPKRPNPSPWPSAGYSSLAPVGANEQKGKGQRQRIAMPPGKIVQGGHISPFSGEEIQIDFPDSLWMSNIGSSIDQAGMCVDTSIQHCFRWLNRQEFEGFRDYFAKTERGGSYPENCDKQMAKWGQLKGLSPQYINYEGSNLELLELALRTGRLVAITYSGRDGIHYNSSVAHMTNLAHLDLKKDEGGILDNNMDSKIIWMSVQELKDRCMDRGKLWAVIPLYDPPPLPPGANIRQARARYRPTLPPGYAWKTAAGQPGLFLWFGNVICGHYSPAKDVYHLRDIYAPTVRWQRGRCAVPLPLHTGVLPWKKPAQERITYGGKPITLAEARKLITGGLDPSSLQDDRWKLHLTFIGSKADETLATFKKTEEYGKYKDILLLNSYTADSWAVKDCGFVTSGQPTVYLQQGRQVLYREDTYKPENLLRALRKADPNYDPKKDPSGQPQLPFNLELPNLTQDQWLLVALAGLGLLIMFKK